MPLVAKGLRLTTYLPDFLFHAVFQGVLWKIIRNVRTFLYTLLSIFMKFWFSVRNHWHFIKKLPPWANWHEIWNVKKMFVKCAQHTLHTFRFFIFHDSFITGHGAIKPNFRWQKFKFSPWEGGQNFVGGGLWKWRIQIWSWNFDWMPPPSLSV